MVSSAMVVVTMISINFGSMGSTALDVSTLFAMDVPVTIVEACAIAKMRISGILANSNSGDHNRQYMGHAAFVSIICF